MSGLARVIGTVLFLTLVIALWYLSAFWPWRTLCGEEGPFGVGWLAALAEPFCARDGLFGIAALDRRGDIVLRLLQPYGLGDFAIVAWGLLAFLILSLAQVVWSRIAGLLSRDK